MLTDILRKQQMDNSRRTAIVIQLDDGTCIWQANEANKPLFIEMDSDYLANVLRLIHRRREELKAVVLMMGSRTPGHRCPDVVENLIDEDMRFIELIYNEFNRREEHEDE